jgi:hypothetical protein
MGRVLLPGPDTTPAETFRWLRRVELWLVPVGVLVALSLAASGSGLWWIGLACAAMGLVGAATLGGPIRRAEGIPAPDRTTLPARRRRAIRVTALTYVPIMLAFVVIIGMSDEWGAAAFVAGVMLVGLALVWRNWRR